MRWPTPPRLSRTDRIPRKPTPCESRRRRQERFDTAITHLSCERILPNRTATASAHTPNRPREQARAACIQATPPAEKNAILILTPMADQGVCPWGLPGGLPHGI